MSIFTYNYMIKYSDVGQNNKLSLNSLVAILQEAAGSHSEIAGYGINNIKSTNSTWLLLNWKVKMISHPHLNETITVKTWPRTLEKIYSYRDFELFDSKDNLIAIATSKWLFIDAKNKKIKRLTNKVSEAYGGIVNKKVFDNEIDDKLSIPENLDLNFTYCIERRDLDTNKHVNNLHYIDFAFETLPEEIYNSNTFDNLEIIYKKEIKYGDTIKCYYALDDDKHLVIIKSEDNSVLHAIIKLWND